MKYSIALLILVTLSGCQGGSRAKEQFGKTYYLDGAGNLGFGASDVPRGLQAAGYQGDVEQVMWTTSFNPLIDQVNMLGAKAAAKGLADRITRYKKKHPSAKVHIVALSAGTGVAVWACEMLDANTKVDNLVLLGSSLSNTYDMRRALAHIKGRVFVYYSSRDAVLQTVEVVGTIDRKTGVKSAGQVGMRSRAGGSGKIVNIGWSPRWSRLGWHGGHTDATSASFVRGEIGPRMLTPEERRPRRQPQTTAAPQPRRTDSNVAVR
jgi:hypothetical protein